MLWWISKLYRVEWMIFTYLNKVHYFHSYFISIFDFPFCLFSVFCFFIFPRCYSLFSTFIQDIYRIKSKRKNSYEYLWNCVLIQLSNLKEYLPIVNFHVKSNSSFVQKSWKRTKQYLIKNQQNCWGLIVGTKLLLKRMSRWNE